MKRIVGLSPDARFLLINAGREITRAHRGKPIADIAKECGIGARRLDELLGAFTRAGLWSYDTTIREGYVTPYGLQVAVEQSMAAA